VDHPDTLRSAYSLAAAVANLGEHDEARRLEESIRFQHGK
jgi:hypothetical protein